MQQWVVVISLCALFALSLPPTFIFTSGWAVALSTSTNHLLLTIFSLSNWCGSIVMTCHISVRTFCILYATYLNLFKWVSCCMISAHCYQPAVYAAAGQFSHRIFQDNFSSGYCSRLWTAQLVQTNLLLWNFYNWKWFNHNNIGKICHLLIFLINVNGREIPWM